MQTKSKISNRQIFFMLVLVINGAYTLIIPHSLARVAGSDGIICMAVSTGIGLVVVAMLHYIAKSHPGETVVAYLPQIFGKYLGKLLGLMLCAYFALVVIFNLRCFVEMLVAELLPNTPRFVLGLVALLLIGWIANNGLEDIARFSTLLAPVVLLMFVLVMVGNFQAVKLVNFLPLGQVSLTNGVMGVLFSLILFPVTLSLLMIYPHSNHAAQLGKTAAWAVLVSGSILCLMIFTILSVFGSHEGARIVWPLVELARMIRVGPFMERVEAVFITVWLSIIFVNGSVLTFCTSAGLCQIFGVKNYKRMNLAVVIFLLVVNMIPQDMIGFLTMQFVYAKFMIPGIGIFIFLLFIGTVFQRKRGSDHEQTPS